MKSILLTSLAFLISAPFLLAQENATKAINKEKTIIIKEKSNGDGDHKAIKHKIEIIESGTTPKNDKIVIKTITDGEEKEEVILLDGNDVDIEQLLDSILGDELNDIDIDIDVSDHSKIKVFKLPGGQGDKIWFQDRDASGSDWIDIEDMMEISEIKAAGANKPFLGVILDDEDEIESGIRVISVVESSAAQEAGVIKEDIITKIDAHEVKSLSDLVEALKDRSVGDKITVKVLREGESKTLNATLKSRAESSQQLSKSFHFKMPECCAGDKSCDHHQRTYRAYMHQPKPKLGVKIENLDQEMIKDLAIRDGKGVLITKVYDESTAAKVGLKINDVITRINDQPIDNVTDLHEFLSDQKLGEEITISYYRYGKLKSGEGVLFEFNHFINYND